MLQYPKIQSIFKRDPDNNYKTFLDEYSTPEIEYLAYENWLFTEKIDGTNICIHLENGDYAFAGRTDKAQIPPKLATALHNLGRLIAGVYDFPMTLFGEGYGAGIQKGGGNYRPDQSFILFDVNVGGLWLRWFDVEDVAVTLGIDVAPIIEEGNLDEACLMAEQGFDSIIAYQPGVAAEGLVCRPEVDLLDRQGRRIITKVKTKDFPHGE